MRPKYVNLTRQSGQSGKFFKKTGADWPSAGHDGAVAENQRRRRSAEMITVTVVIRPA
ncbi:hypothetical protein BVG79_01796 [Ketogulonicigenium robustum]|uniref:Uncharacterized protein n=1 Tax=Ketogulonicigenium robustum TaxID=92947 RepID=A0A1W6P1D9_9RHOB|nr:hypothetical protein BVG79_01796 [Ketogulonicigenium robustum]